MPGGEAIVLGCKLCVLYPSDDLAKLAHNVRAARTDYRDVIWWAEYDGGEQRLRDFSQPLP